MTVTAPTPSQTVGPFFRFGMAWLDACNLVAEASPAAITLTGRVSDGVDEPVPDAVVEIWQADRHGQFGPEAEWPWTGFGRCLTGSDGEFRFTTVKPGAVDNQAPHIDVSVFARGLLQRVVTRVYFPDEAAANSVDPVLQSIGDLGVRSTLVASVANDASDEQYGELRFDIHLQGDEETAFFVW